MRVLLTGAAGFIGSHVHRALVTAGHEVIAVDALLEPVHAAAGPPEGVTPVDIRDPDALVPLLRGVDVVVHLAAALPPGSLEPNALGAAAVQVSGPPAVEAVRGVPATDRDVTDQYRIVGDRPTEKLPRPGGSRRNGGQSRNGGLPRPGEPPQTGGMPQIGGQSRTGGQQPWTGEVPRVGEPPRTGGMPRIGGQQPRMGEPPRTGGMPRIGGQSRAGEQYESGGPSGTSGQPPAGEPPRTGGVSQTGEQSRADEQPPASESARAGESARSGEQPGVGAQPGASVQPDTTAELLAAAQRDAMAAHRELAAQRRGAGGARPKTAHTPRPGEPTMQEAPNFAAHNDFGTAVLLAAMERAGIERLVLGSSVSVYGEGRYRGLRSGPFYPGVRLRGDLDRGMFDHRAPRTGEILTWETVGEDTPLRPRTAYAASKVAQENYAMAWGATTGGGVTVLRYHHVYGDPIGENSALTAHSGVAARFRAELTSGGAPFVYEDGGQVRDFVHVRDVAAATVAVVQRPLSGFVPLNIASGHPITLWEVASIMSRASGGPRPVVSGQYRMTDARHIAANPERARRTVNFSATVSPEQGLAEYAVSMR